MNKEPVGLYILRLSLSFALFGLLLMIYWSSSIIELDLKMLNEELINLRKEMNQVQQNSDRIREEFSRKAEIIRQAPSQPIEKKTVKSDVHVHMDPNLPNLLEEDPFFEKTLPNLLGASFVPKGLFQQATYGKPENLHPFSGWRDVSNWQGLCSLSLSKLQFGKYETLAPYMAIKIEERNPGTDKQEYWIFLRDNVYWQPLKQSMFSNDLQLAPHFFEKHQVTAEDFKFYFDAVMNPYVQQLGAISLRAYIGDIKEIEVIDKLTLVIRWRIHDVDGKPQVVYSASNLMGGLNPLASWVYKYFPDGTKIIGDDANLETYRTNSIWAQNFNDHWARNIIVSCGPWVFEGMNDENIKFKRNPDFFESLGALAQGIQVTFKQSPENIWKDFKTNEIDSFTLPSDQLNDLEDFLDSPEYAEQVANKNGIERLDYVARSYAYIAWNQNKHLFKSRKVRQAMTMAIDRNRIINQNLNGMAVPINGTFFRYSKAYDPSIPFLPYDPETAKQMLAEEGWYDSDGDGIIDKEINGKRVPFKYQLTYYVKNQTSKAICDYVATAMREIGVDCRLHGVDIADISNELDDKSFDALFLNWALGTPPDNPRQLWHSSGAREKGSSNITGFVNERADVIIDKLEFERNPERRIELYHEFDRILYNEQPYTFLYTPKAIFLYRSYIQNVFIPADRQDLIPGADIAEPDSSIFWIKKRS